MHKIKKTILPDVFRFYITIPFFKLDIELLQYDFKRGIRNIFAFRITMWKWSTVFMLGKRDYE